MHYQNLKLCVKRKKIVVKYCNLTGSKNNNLNYIATDGQIAEMSWHNSAGSGRHFSSADDYS